MSKFMPALRPDPNSYVRLGIPVVGTLTQEYHVDLGTALSEHLELGPEQKAVSLEAVTGFAPMELREDERLQHLPEVMRALENEARIWLRLPFDDVSTFMEIFYDKWWFRHHGRDWTLQADGKRPPVIERVWKPDLLKRNAHNYIYHSPLVLRPENTSAVLEEAVRILARRIDLAPETVKLVWVRDEEDAGHHPSTTYTGVSADGYRRDSISGFQVVVVGDFGKKKQKGYTTTAIAKLLTWGLGDGRLYGCGVFTPMPRELVRTEGSSYVELHDAAPTEVAGE